MKTLVFCTSYHSSLQGWDDRQAIWIEALRRSDLLFDQLLIVDDGSSVLPAWPYVEIVSEKDCPTAADVASSAPIVLYTHSERLGRASVFEFPGWYRSFAFGVLYGVAHGFEKIIHIESDAFLITKAIQTHFNRFTSGWMTVWCQAYQFPEIAIQAAAGDEIATMADFVRRPYSQMQGQIHEFLFPFTHVERMFVGNRYGEMIGHVPAHADYSAQTHTGQPDSYYWWIQGRGKTVGEATSCNVRAPFASDTLEGGWSAPEAGCHWMLNLESILYIPAASNSEAYELLIDLTPCSYLDRKQQSLFVLVNNRLVQAVSLSRPVNVLCRLPAGSLRSDRPNQIRFLHPDAFVPADIGPHPEKRRLSFALSGYTLRSVSDL